MPRQKKLTKKYGVEHLAQRRSSVGILARKSLALTLSIVIATQPLMVQAQEIRADQAANAANQPRIGASGNGVPLIDIVTPNAAGLSHNKYGAFNVGPTGVILNNSNQDLQRSQLGGLVQGNANLGNSGPASVILNEVTGSNRSLLQGALEVHGGPANVVIANPNGLTCDGCGFINTPRVTLSTGTPELSPDGSLSGLNVNGGDIRIGRNGADLGSVNIFDIVSRTIAVDGPVRAGGQLNLVAGRNSYAYQSGLITPLESDGDEPAIAIDSSLLGGMYAGSIKVISTEQGAGVKMSGDMAANAGAMTLSADGKLTLGKAQAKQAITARSSKQTVTVESTLFSDNAIVLEGLSGVKLADNAMVVAKGDVSLKGQAITLGTDALAASGTDHNGQQSRTGALSIEASTLEAGKGQLAGGGLLAIKADAIDLTRTNDTGRDTLRSLSDMTIETTSIDALNARITAGGNLAVTSANSLTLNGGRYVSNGALLAQAASLTSSASLAAKSSSTLNAFSGDLKTSGEIAGDGGVSLSSEGNVENSGRIVSTAKTTITANGTLRNMATGLVAANGGVEASAGSIINNGSIAAQGGMLDVRAQNDLDNTGTLLSVAAATVSAGTNIGNSGELVVEDALSLHANAGTITSSGTINGGKIDIEAAALVNQGLLTAHDQSITTALSGNLQNAGTMSARDAIALSVDGDVTISGKLEANGLLTLAGRNNDLAGNLNTASGALINGNEGLSLKAASLTNAGSVGTANGALLVDLSGNLSNSGLLYSGTSSTYRVDGGFTNINADVLAETDLSIKGLTGSRAGALDNRSGTIEAIAGDMVLDVASLTNRRDGLTAALDTTTESTTSGATTTTVVTKRERATANGPASQLLAGGNVTIATNALTNSYSQIAANGDIAIAASSILNEGRDLIETVETTAVTQHSERYCARRIVGICIDRDTRYWTTTDSNTSSRTYDSVFGTIEAGGTLSANVTGYLTNNAIRERAGQIGLSSGDRALSEAEVSAASTERNLTSISALNISVDSLLGRQATFQPATSPNMPFLIETRSEFVDPGRFLGSDYFLKLVGGYDPDAPLRRLGDAYVEYRLIRDQIFNLTGSRDLGSNLDANQLMQALYNNAAETQQSLGLAFGVALSASQIGALTKDMVWLEKQTVDGQEVLVPRLYLSSSTMANTSLASAQIKAGQATIEAAALTNSGAISAVGNLSIDTSAALFNNGGSLFAGADVVIDAGSIFSNRSGTVSGRNVTVEADTIVNDTAKLRDVYANGFADRVQQTARIEARDDLLLKSSGSIVSEGGQFAAGDDLLLDAGGAIEISALELERSRDDAIEGGYDRAYKRTNTLAELQAGGSVVLDAGDDLALRGATISAGEDVKLQADGDVSIASVQNQESRDLKLDIKTRGLLGTETNIRRQSSSVETDATTITAGRDLFVKSQTGDVTLQAPQLKSGGETRLEAEDGKVALLTNTDQTFKQDFKREEDLLWWNERDQGKAEETIRHVEIEAGGGLKIDAGNGVVIEYHKTGNLEASLDQLSQSPGLAWVGELRNDPALSGKVDWKAVDAQFQQWDYKSQGLTEAGAALVTLVTTALTAGAGGFTASLSSSLASSLGIQNAAMQTALQAGVQSLINKSAIALINNQGDLGAALKELGSSASIRGLLTSMVAAGLTAQFSDMAGIGADLPASAPLADRVAQDIQRSLIRASVKASVSTAIEGGKLDESLFDAFRLEASATLGKYVAEEIGQAAHNRDIDKVTQLIAHAALGCAAGALASGDCKGGAIGGVVGEVSADLVDKSIKNALLKGNLTQAEALVMVTEWRANGIEIARVAAGLAAALAGGDVDTGANAGANAAENNAFFIPIIVVILSAAYTTGVGDGDPMEGLARIGRGDDPLSKAMAAATEAGVEWSARHYPEETMAVLGVLEAANNAMDATLTYVDETTGKEVSKRWNDIDPHTRDQLKGAGKVLSVVLPAGSVKLLKELKTASKSPDLSTSRPRLTIRDQYAHHNAMRTDVIEQLEAQGYRVADGEASFGNSCGVGRCRPDILYETPDGRKGIIEIKTGNADLSIRQTKIFPQIENGDAIPKGSVAQRFGLRPGIPLRDQGYPNGIPIEVRDFPGAK
jgi:filamentous hemagglutinin